jgi:hypothetical protein
MYDHSQPNRQTANQARCVAASTAKQNFSDVGCVGTGPNAISDFTSAEAGFFSQELGTVEQTEIFAERRASPQGVYT